MEEMAVSKFKATCLSVLERVRKTKQPILVTRFGKPVAQVIPPSTPERSSSWIGALKGTGKITGDIVAPVVEEQDWDALR